MLTIADASVTVLVYKVNFLLNQRYQDFITFSEKKLYNQNGYH